MTVLQVMNLTLPGTGDYASYNSPGPRVGSHKNFLEGGSYATNSHLVHRGVVLCGGSKRPNQSHRNGTMRQAGSRASTSRRRSAGPQLGRGAIQMYVDETDGNRGRQVQGRSKHGDGRNHWKHVKSSRLSRHDDGKRRQVLRAVSGHGDEQRRRSGGT